MKPILKKSGVLLLAIISLACSPSRQALRPKKLPEMKLEKIYFHFAQWKIAPDQTGSMKKNAEALKKESNVRVLLEGHTDSRGPAGFNLYLGDRRARAVKSSLQGLGVDPRRLMVISRGEAKPAESNRTRQGRAKNRRVEFVPR